MEKATSAPRKERLQQQVEELCGAAVRALSEHKAFRFRGRKATLNGRYVGIRAPHLYPSLSDDDFRSFRGAADGIALRLQHSDHQRHQQLMPDDAVSQFLFELMEQLRVESLVDDRHPGVKGNLKHRYEQWCAAYCASQMIESHVGLLVYSIAQIVWSRMSGYPVEEATEGLIEPQRMMLAPLIGVHLAQMRRLRHTQAEYAEQALGICLVIRELVDVVDHDDDDDAKRAQDNEEVIANFRLMLEPEDAGSSVEQPVADNSPRALKALNEQLQQYRIFSNERDQVVRAHRIVRPELLKRLRDELDTRIRGQGVNVPRLARELSQLLSTPHREGWSFGHEEGHLDARRLSRLVTSPAYRQLFRQEQYLPRSHSQVTFLLDNSGSMKNHIGPIAMLVDIFVRALEQAGAKTEVLGFTTRAWQGGRVYRQWRAAGQPENPGRLTELQHIIYKDSEQTWRRHRQHIAALLKPDLFREGIDGEALLWAAQRLRQGNAERKILIVISDGSPMETATHLHNEADYLDNHLKQVAASLECQGDIELYALGVGLDLSRYYRHQHALDLPETLENSVFTEILQMIAKRHRH